MKRNDRYHLWRWPSGVVRLWVVLTLALSGLALSASLPALHAAPCACCRSPGTALPNCVDFEGLTLGTTYNVGDTFVDSGAVITAQSFTWSNGTVFSGGSAQVGNAGLAGGSGLEMNTNNINLAFDFGGTLTGLFFRFGEYGGNLNIEVNGDFQNFENYQDIDGKIIGGVSVSVVNGFGNDAGWVHLSGTIDSFAVGGQELWIDDVCPRTCCVDFESLAPGATYNVGDTFLDSCAEVSVRPFQWSDGTMYSGGYAQVGNAGLAGGFGLEVNTNNVNLTFDFGGPLKGLALNFGEYGGNLNIEVNGDFRNFQNFQDIDGLVIGGATIVVVNGLGNDMGRLFVIGSVTSFTVGGQELWIDNVCPETCCVDFESLTLGATYNVGDTFLDSCAEVSVRPFQWSDGTMYSGGYAQVGNAGLAGGSGLEMNTNNVNLAFDFGVLIRGLTMLFGEYGGNLNIEVNGDFQNFENFQDIDGKTIGGASVSVVNGLGNDKGRLQLTGMIHQFSVGGQELWIDELCPDRLEHSIFVPLVIKAAP